MNTKEKFNTLAELGAGDFQHLNGTLIEHLKGTARLLQLWGARAVLQDAGLYHAAYGTAGFDSAMVGLDMRDKIAEVIGTEAEQLVYLYCSCDRDFVFSHLNNGPVGFRDRFTSAEFVLSEKRARDFCELTVANEMELVLASAEFRQEHGEGLRNLFEKMTTRLSPQAIRCFRDEI